MSIDRDSRILIVGAGTFGLSAAWHLARRGYSNITAIDRYESPSKDSAGYDLNKIFRTEYADPLYSKLAHQSRRAWLEEGTLKGCYHETGYIFSVCGQNQKSVKNFQDAVDNSVRNGVVFEKLDRPEDFRAKAAVMDGPMEGWRGVFNPKAGWTHSHDALKAVYEDCLRLGVTFVFGAPGAAKSLIQTQSGMVSGIISEDGTHYYADKVILACGAWLDSIIDTKGQILAKCWCLVHIKLSQEEAEQWRNMPVINNRELGYLFEPDIAGRRLKVAPHGVGYTRYVTPGRSVPRSQNDYPSDGIPTEDKELVRELLRQCLPTLAERPFIYSRMCWDSDTPDAHFRITSHPEHPHLYFAGGGSAHGFKFFPIIGKYVADLLEGLLDSDLANAWRWKPNQEFVKDASRLDGPEADLRDLKGWMNDRVARL